MTEPRPPKCDAPTRPVKRFVFTGSRRWTWTSPVLKALNLIPDDAIVAVGDAKGLDYIVANLANALGRRIEIFGAVWYPDGIYDPDAGKNRNIDMLDDPFGTDGVIAFPLSDSKGTRHCMREARRRGIPVVEFSIPGWGAARSTGSGGAR